MHVIPTSLDCYHIHPETEAESFLVEEFIKAFLAKGITIIVHAEKGELTVKSNVRVPMLSAAISDINDADPLEEKINKLFP